MRINKNLLMLFFITFFIGCANTVSDTVSSTDYLGIDGIDYDGAVSYTHLTLPTIYSV